MVGYQLTVGLAVTARVGVTNDHVTNERACVRLLRDLENKLNKLHTHTCLPGQRAMTTKLHRIVNIKYQVSSSFCTVNEREIAKKTAPRKMAAMATGTAVA